MSVIFKLLWRNPLTNRQFPPNQLWSHQADQNLKTLYRKRKVVHIMAVSAEIERVIDQGNYLMPDINMSQSDLANPTEPIVTKIMVHYLRCFGFRVEPPYKIGSELAHSSREARVFLIRVCRQVERIIQICFPNKTYTYLDIIKPGEQQNLKTFVLPS